ncbi:MAG: hypothetical protein AB1481_07395 [Candidatus Omnitrophota bacterium]
MVRSVDFESRRRQVLNAAINRYIQNGAAVSSEEMARDFDLSPATIRNVFAELEEGGYLTHPYTSGGRIPTVKGYRYYVDFLSKQLELMQGEKEKIAGEYRKEMMRLEDALEETSEIISRLTHYTGIVSFLEWQDKFFYKGISQILEYREFHDFENIRLLFKVIEEKQTLLEIINRDFEEKVKVYIGSELDCPEMQNCSLVVSSYSRRSKPSGKLAVLGPVRMEYKHIIPTLDYISDVLSTVLDNF